MKLTTREVEEIYAVRLELEPLAAAQLISGSPRLTLNNWPGFWIECRAPGKCKMLKNY